MSKIAANFFISLDGVIESPDKWHFPYFNDEMGATIGKGTERYKAFMMGRVLYSEWSEYWPQQSAEVPFASFINSVPKYVVSNSLKEARWNNTTVLSGDVGEVQKIKERSDGDIGISGSATLVRWLLGNDLLDELHLLVHPIVVGHGEKLFQDSPTHPLKLVHSETFETGVLYLTYTPAT